MPGPLTITVPDLDSTAVLTAGPQGRVYRGRARATSFTKKKMCIRRRERKKRGKKEKKRIKRKRMKRKH